MGRGDEARAAFPISVLLQPRIADSTHSAQNTPIKARRTETASGPSSGFRCKLELAAAQRGGDFTYRLHFLVNLFDIVQFLASAPAFLAFCSALTGVSAERY